MCKFTANILTNITPPPLLLTIFIQILGENEVFVRVFRVFRCVSHGLRSHDHRPLPVLSPQGRSVHGPISLPADISVIQWTKAQRISPALTKGTEWAAHWYWMSPSSALNEQPISIEWETMSESIKKEEQLSGKTSVWETIALPDSRCSNRRVYGKACP